MSTRIKRIKGRYEYEAITRRGIPLSGYATAELDLTRFWGGTANGRMLQPTIQSDRTAYIQLTQEQVKELAQTLLDSFDDKIYPSE